VWRLRDDGICPKGRRIFVVRESLNVVLQRRGSAKIDVGHHFSDCFEGLTLGR
jgi:hypothetical protein